MPNIGKRSGKLKDSKGKYRKSKNEDKVVKDDDRPLSSSVAPDEDLETKQESGLTVATVMPFEDGLVNVGLRGLPTTPRTGGEEISVLHDFLILFSKTETFVGAISSKTSFMKKTGGRLL